MRIVLSSTSTSIAALAASQAFFTIGSASDVADDIAYKHDGRINHTGQKSTSSGDECSLPQSVQAPITVADTGILRRCSDPRLVCIEDTLSSLGGRCVDIAASVQRKLMTCTKCANGGCNGLSQDFIDKNIGEGSCCGPDACTGASGDVKIGKNSCIGYAACYYVNGVIKINDGSCIGRKNCYRMVNATIGKGSCTGGSSHFGFACAFLQGSVGDKSCSGFYSCYGYDSSTNNGLFSVGSNSCIGRKSCRNADGVTIGRNSCQGLMACEDSKADIGNGSCIGDYACDDLFYKVTIGDYSCIGYYACYDNDAKIGRNSCIGKQACDYNYAAVGDNACKGDYVCQNNDNYVPSSPTSSPSRPPSKKTLNPTSLKPTKAKSTKDPKETKEFKLTRLI